MRLSSFPVPFACLAVVAGLSAFHGCSAQAQESRVVLDRNGSTIVLEPYAPNIIRVTLSTLKDPALAPAGYGFTASPSPQGWSYRHTDAEDIYQSSRLTVTIPAIRPRGGQILASQADIAKFFGASGEPRHAGARITFRTADGKTFLDMERWFMSPPSYERGDMDILHDRRPSDVPFYFPYPRHPHV